MDAKRRRINEDGVGNSKDYSGLISSSTLRDSSLFENLSAITAEHLKTKDFVELQRHLSWFKRCLVRKDLTVFFVDQSKSSGTFSAIVDLFIKCTTELSDPRSQYSCILKDVLSILANCCNFSTSACLEMKQPHVRFSHLSVRILESGSLTSIDCKATLLRLLANMCAHKETALCVASNSSLIDCITLLLDSDHPPTLKQALRVIRGLVAASFTRIILLSNAGFYLGKVLVKREESNRDIISILLSLAKQNVRDTGRQLAGSDCCDRLLSLFLKEEIPEGKQLIVTLCEGSTDMRDRMGEAGIIQKVVESGDGCALNCNLLVAFAQEAWGRASLRESGALDFLVRRFSLCKIARDRLSIVFPLRHFIHDTTGMAHLARNRLFIDTVVTDVIEYLKENSMQCTPEVRTDGDIYRPDSPLLMEIQSTVQRRSDSDEDPRLHKDFSSLWAYSISPAYMSAWTSPMYSPPSSGTVSSTGSATSSPVTRCSQSIPVPHTSTSEITEESIQIPTRIDEVRKERAIIDSELWLLAWQAQEDSNLPHLIREDVLDAVLGYLSLAPSADFRVGRILRRMASSRASVDTILNMQFHTRVLHMLCTVPCRVIRYARRCGRCEKSAEFGREVLREFASHVDSDFGHSFLVKRLTSEDFNTRTQAAIAKVALIKDSIRIDRRLSGGHRTALDVLFESLFFLLTRENFDNTANRSTYDGGPPICAQIIGAISTLIPAHWIRQVFEVDAIFRPRERGLCIVKDTEGNSLHHAEMLRFNSSDGSVLAQVPMESMCANSAYFQGMFSADLAEKCLKQRVFTFDSEKEGCSEQDFVRFLHCLAGCKASCTAIHSPTSCAAMIQLSDRYLCPSLSEAICGPHGPARRLLTGNCLPVLLPAALSTNTHPSLLNICLLTLMRYTTSSDVVSTLRSISHSPTMIDSFLKQLRAFVSI